MPNTNGAHGHAPVMPRSTVPLSTVPVGSTVVVRGINASEHGVDVRLGRVGFITGTHVLVERRAPLGDPTVYALRGYRLGLRAEAAELIQVELLDAPVPPR